MARGQKGQKIVAEDNIEHVLIVHLFIRKMSQRNKSCPVKEKTYTEKEKGQQGVLRTKCRQIIQGPAIKGKIDDAGGDTDNDKNECYITLLLYHRLENKKTDKELSLEILCIGKMQFGVMAKAFSPFLLDDFFCSSCCLGAASKRKFKTSLLG